jgi:hypothetical protein
MRRGVSLLLSFALLITGCCRDRGSGAGGSNHPAPGLASGGLAVGLGLGQRVGLERGAEAVEFSGALSLRRVTRVGNDRYLERLGVQAEIVDPLGERANGQRPRAAGR